jgi:transcriptional regulator with XRE-family HTH domain
MDAQPLDVLKDWRKRQEPRLTVTAAARRVGVSKSAWSRYEAGKRKVDLEVVPRIALETGIHARHIRPDLADTFGEAAE